MTKYQLISDTDAYEWRKPIRRPRDPFGFDGSGSSAKRNERRLGRIATVAATTGARFSREGIAQDPVAWLSTPKQLFTGSNALTACQGRDSFIGAILLHGLSIGLDCHPHTIARLVETGRRVRPPRRRAK